MSVKKNKLDVERLKIIYDALESHINAIKRCVVDSTDVDFTAYYCNIIIKTDEIRDYIKARIQKEENKCQNSN